MTRVATGVLATLVLAGVVAAPAHGAEFVQYAGFASNTHSVRLGPDGNVWVSEENAHSVARIDLQGKLLQRFAVGGAPGTVAVGPGGRVWVTVSQVPGADKLVWFDALSATPTAHDVSTSAVSDCPPVGIVAGGNGALYFSLPADPGFCAAPSRVAFVNENGTGAMTFFAGRGTVFDLAVAGGKLFAPDFDGDVVRRITLNASLTIESTTNVTPGSNPDGVAVDGAGNVWTSLFGSGKVARFPAAQNGGAATVLTPSGGTLTSPFGLAAGFDGAMYVTGWQSGNLARIDVASNAFSFFTAPAGAEPLKVAPGNDSDMWASDRSNPRVLRLVFGKPRLGATGADADSPTSAVLRADVDPRGAGQLTFDYGTSAAYGQTASAAVGSRAWSATERVSISGLAPATEYHARARTANAEGETAGADFTFTTPAAPPPPPQPPVVPPVTVTPALAAKIVFGTKRRGAVTRVAKLRVQKLAGGETIRVRCTGNGCPRKGRTVTGARAGTRKLDALLVKRRLRKGAIVRVLVTKAGFKGRAATLTVRKGKAPTIRRTCLAVGATTPAPCA
ncbi:MAG TPA: hypothetical protein VF549_11615 [Solirubrobacteraceae bacterium]|jgi:streptogramin lyase